MRDLTTESEKNNISENVNFDGLIAIYKLYIIYETVTLISNTQKTSILCCFTETSRYRQGRRRHTICGSRLTNRNTDEKPSEGWPSIDVAPHSPTFTEIRTKLDMIYNSRGFPLFPFLSKIVNIWCFLFEDIFFLLCMRIQNQSVCE